MSVNEVVRAGRKTRTEIEAARTAILILGMHRSGTSVLTRLFSLLGCDLPRHLIDPTPDNELGHWEPANIVKLDDQILESAGTTWDDWVEFNPRWYRSPKAGEFRERAREALDFEFARSRFFVLKDPRICRFPKFWIEALQDFGARPAAVIPVRSPLEVAASLQKRDGFNVHFSHLMWLRHMLDAELGSRGLTRFFISYDEILSAWSNLAEEAETALQISWPRMSDRTADEIEAFLREDFRHHASAKSSVLKNMRLSQWLRHSYEIFSRWAEAGEDEHDHAALDAIRAELGAATPAFAQLITAGRAASRRVHDLAERADGLEGKLTHAEGQIDELEAHLRGLQSRLVQREGELEQIRRERERDVGEAQRTAEDYRKHVELLLKDARELFEVEARHLKEIDRLREEVADARASQEIARADAAKLSASRELGLAIAVLRSNSRLHFVRNWRIRRQAAALRRSGLLDADWYLARNQDVAEAGIDPAVHFLLHGAEEGRQPRPAMDEASTESPGQGGAERKDS